MVLPGVRPGRSVLVFGFGVLDVDGDTGVSLNGIFDPRDPRGVMRSRQALEPRVRHPQVVIGFVPVNVDVCRWAAQAVAGLVDRLECGLDAGLYPGEPVDPNGEDHLGHVVRHRHVAGFPHGHTAPIDAMAVLSSLLGVLGKPDNTDSHRFAQGS